MLIWKRKLLLNFAILDEPLQDKYFMILKLKKKKEIQDQLKSVEVLL